MNVRLIKDITYIQPVYLNKVSGMSGCADTVYSENTFAKDLFSSCDSSQLIMESLEGLRSTTDMNLRFAKY